MAASFKVRCENGHEYWALAGDDLTIEQFLDKTKCKTCGSTLRHIPFSG